MSYYGENQDNIKSNQYYQRFIMKIIVLTATGIFCGWLGGFAILSFLPDTEKKSSILLFLQNLYSQKTSSNHTNMSESSQDNGHLLPLKPIITNFDSSPEHWLRLDISLICKDIPKMDLLETLHQDIMAYVRTISIDQIKGPQGFRYLREDLKERINWRSKDLVSRVILRTFIVV
ncbi:MAG: flagellar basal body-associated FliL family protein [Candidatus Liberibacter ctenarytainae]|uniref:Flagellar protein FliL n=1 Tax=Candidatus Liberibacter ctenarytainae TaxID=2020335 RepID=A0A937AKT9_9HYPH|nr:flagellar basal body-associated FliL family protein [Candidatus Liberibacter ctenarytainae]